MTCLGTFVSFAPYLSHILPFLGSRGIAHLAGRRLTESFFVGEMETSHRMIKINRRDRLFLSSR